ncbi:acyl carrier protein [Anaeromassilibacillus senegalensis]|uniref:Acyl carrier protein n=1 Tax=Anaeromassilibacillus senegalensis TaxID=1673717 RepID=A0ABS9CPJ5_9FIRM|nr:acyl carrier protein [Anaeromassilibacillus senegalensis]MCF2653064.1 acyl carrier protein [Anaeromassilibacillus senegalensis]MCI5651786.1 acyl carrier protein [Ruminococcus bromii]MDD7647906.1 acyl carrier protein [Ruminococcus bromii]
MVLDKVIEILADQLSVDPSIINEDSNLVDDLDADSLAVIDLIMCIEDEFNVEVPDEEVENLKTVGAIVQFIENHQ